MFRYTTYNLCKFLMQATSIISQPANLSGNTRKLCLARVSERKLSHLLGGLRPVNRSRPPSTITPGAQLYIKVLRSVPPRACAVRNSRVHLPSLVLPTGRKFGSRSQRTVKI